MKCEFHESTKTIRFIVKNGETIEAIKFDCGDANHIQTKKKKTRYTS